MILRHHRAVRPCRTQAVWTAGCAGCCLTQLAFAAGCDSQLDFEAHTRISADPSVVRTARLVGSGKKEDIAARFVLPPGRFLRDPPTQRASNGGTDRARVDVCETTQARRPGEPLTPDHVLRSAVSDRTARNEIRVTVERGWFVTSFTCEERFTDVVTQAGFERSARELYGLAVDWFAADLAPRASPPIRVDEMRRAITASQDAPFERYLQRLHALGFGAFIADAALQDEAEADIEPEAIAARLVRALPSTADRDAGRWSSLVDEAIERFGSLLDSRFARFGDELFGVYGVAFYQSYGFHVDVDLPGTLSDTNATSRSPGRPDWRFVSEDFWDNPVVLQARSRMWHPWRITATAAIVPACGALLWGRSRRRSRARSGGG